MFFVQVIIDERDSKILKKNYPTNQIVNQIVQFILTVLHF